MSITIGSLSLPFKIYGHITTWHTFILYCMYPKIESNLLEGSEAIQFTVMTPETTVHDTQ